MSGQSEAKAANKAVQEFREEFEAAKPAVSEICKAVGQLIPEMAETFKPVVDAITEHVMEVCLETLEDERIPKATAAHHMIYVNEMLQGLREMGLAEQDCRRIVAAGLSRR